MRNQRTVLIIVENLPVPFDRRVWQEAQALREAGYGVSVICPKGKGHDLPYEELNGIHIYRHPLPIEASRASGYLVEYSIALFWEFWLSLKVWRKHGFDAIQACNPPDLIFLIGGFYKFLFGKKFVFDQHDLNPELYEVKFGRKSGVFYRLLCLFEKLTFKCADASIATNETFKRIAIERGGMDADKVAIVKSYPDLTRFKPVPSHPAVRGRFSHVVGYVGIMGNQDGVDILVRAMAHIVHSLNRQDVGCIVIGSGSELENLKHLATTCGVSDHVKFTGYLTGGDLLGHLCSLDIGVIPDPPSVCNDKLSMNKVFEYMALGLPFVQFDLQQSRLEAGEAGYVVKSATPQGLAEAMVALLEDVLLRKRMSKIGQEKAQREFRWDTERQSLVKLYYDLFGGRINGGPDGPSPIVQAEPPGGID
jgi:glycosyltransferase involved in cell wall biosynthesis